MSGDGDNVIELKPGIRIDPNETDESRVLNGTGAMVALAILAQRYERDATEMVLPIEDSRLVVHIISPLCTLLQKNPQLAIDLIWQISEIVADNTEELDEDYEDV